MRAGLPPEHARRLAILELGGIEQARERVRTYRHGAWLDEIGRDVRYAVRLVVRNPGFTGIIVLTLALGIGANTAIFSVIDAVRLRDLPVRAPDRLHAVRIGSHAPSGNFTSRYSDLSYAQWEQIERRQQAFTRIAAWSPRQFNLAGGGERRPAEGMLVSGGFFEMLGVPASQGRVLGPHDDGCASPAAVVSYAFWQRTLGGDSATVGSQLRVDGHPFTIVGITPERFFGVEVGRSYDIAIPLCAEALLAGPDSQLTARRHNYWLSVMGRLADGRTASQADQHLRMISTEVFSATLPEDITSADDRQRYTSMWLHAVPAGKGFSWLRVDYEKPLWLLLALAALVLLIACGNLANLLLARASARRQETAVRLALGATKRRLVQQLLTESLLLALGGAALGLAVARWTSTALVSFLVTADNPVALDTGPDWRVLAFSSIVALITCALFGLAPALRTAASVPASTRSIAGAPDRSMVVRALVAVQIALSVVLVAGAMLFGRTVHNLLTGDVGFQPGEVLITSLDTRRLGLDGERQKVLFGNLLAQLRATRGVVAAAQSNIVPMSGWESNTSVTLDNGQTVSTRMSMVSPGYFQALGTTLLAGRDFGPMDGEDAETALVVNEAFARTFLPGASPVGRSVRFEGTESGRIVGLVRNTKYRALREDFQPIVFFTTSQKTFTSNYARYVVRSTLPWTEVTRAIRESVASVSPSIDVEFVPLATQIRQSVVRERLMGALAMGFGVVAALLAAAGLYGMLSYSVETRRREIGIRLALGADRGAVIRLVMRQTAWLLGIGIVAGLAITMAASRTAASLLYGLQPNDPVTLAAAVITLLVIGLASA